MRGDSMEPTLTPGTLFVYDTNYYATHPIQPGDVVVLKNAGETWIKRVYGTPGKLFWALVEHLDGRLVRTPISASSREKFEAVAKHDRKRGQNVRVVSYRVLPRHVFVLGDGVTSLDSRVFGQISVDQIVGRVVAPRGIDDNYRPDKAEWKLPKLVGQAAVQTPQPERT